MVHFPEIADYSEELLAIYMRENELKKYPIEKIDYRHINISRLKAKAIWEESGAKYEE